MTIGMWTGCCSVTVISIPFLGVTLGIRSVRCLVHFSNGNQIQCCILHNIRYRYHFAIHRATDGRPASKTLLLLQQRRKLHVQLEVLTGMMNNMFRDVIPSALLIMLLGAVLCNVLIAKVDGSQLGVRYPLVLIVGVFWSNAFTSGGYIFLRLAEDLRNQSVEFLRSIQLEALVEALLVRNGGEFRGRSRGIIAERMRGRRKPLELNFGHFGVFAEGDVVTYALAVLENTVNLVFMVDTSARMYLLTSQ